MFRPGQSDFFEVPQVEEVGDEPFELWIHVLAAESPEHDALEGIGWISETLADPIDQDASFPDCSVENEFDRQVRPQFIGVPDRPVIFWHMAGGEDGYVFERTHPGRFDHNWQPGTALVDYQDRIWLDYQKYGQTMQAFLGRLNQQPQLASRLFSEIIFVAAGYFAEQLCPFLGLFNAVQDAHRGLLRLGVELLTMG